MRSLNQNPTMTKTHLKDVVKLDNGTFAQWRTGIKNILIKEGEWKVVSGRHMRPHVPRKDDTTTVANPPGDSTNPLAYDLGDKTVATAWALQDECVTEWCWWSQGGCRPGRFLAGRWTAWQWRPGRIPAGWKAVGARCPTRRGGRAKNHGYTHTTAYQD